MNDVFLQHTKATTFDSRGFCFTGIKEVKRFNSPLSIQHQQSTLMFITISDLIVHSFCNGSAGFLCGGLKEHRIANVSTDGIYVMVLNSNPAYDAADQRQSVLI